MQINLNSGESLTAVQAAGVTTTAPTAKVDYNDGSGPRTAMGSLSGVTAVTLLTGPTNGVRSVRGLSILNGDTVAQTITINHVQGGTTGLIPAGAKNVTVTSDNADKQISLPAAEVGDEIRILVGSTGCELISAVAAHKVNDVVVGATNEAALTATNLYVRRYVAENTWVVVGYTKLGAVQSALVPDAL